jgi:heme-degrading monooxygenase HmoA
VSSTRESFQLEDEMSVMVVTKFDVPASTLEEMVNGRHGETVLQLRESAVTAGAIRHVFAEDTDGKLMVVDEWPSEEAFRAFFANQPAIQQLMADAGVTGPPNTTTYRILDAPDRI